MTIIQYLKRKSGDGIYSIPNPNYYRLHLPKIEDQNPPAAWPALSSRLKRSLFFELFPRSKTPASVAWSRASCSASAALLLESPLELVLSLYLPTIYSFTKNIYGVIENTPILNSQMSKLNLIYNLKKVKFPTGWETWTLPYLTPWKPTVFPILPPQGESVGSRLGRRLNRFPDPLPVRFLHLNNTKKYW